MSRASRAPADPTRGAGAQKADAPKAKAPAQKTTTTADYSLTQEELDDIKIAFDLFDSDGSGTIDPREVAAAVNSLGADRTPSIFRLLAGLEDHTEELDYDGFVAHIAERLGNRSTSETIQRVFELFDDDNSGTIDITKLKRVAAELGESLTVEELEGALKRNSTSGSSVLTPEEFYTVLTKKFYQ